MNKQLTQVQSRPTTGKAFTQFLTPRFLLRVGGLPVDCIDGLHFQQTAQWQNNVLSLERLLKRDKEHLVDILHRTVGAYRDEQQSRRRLINLKRDVFNLRLPQETAKIRVVADLLKPDEGVLFNAWLDLWEQYQQQLALGPAVLEQEMQQKRLCLKEAINRSDFRKGLLLASPLLDQAVETYIQGDEQDLNREARTVERSLLEYLFRTACKTSPFSTFTPVCLGTIEPGGGHVERDIVLDLKDSEKKSFTRLNMVILARISSQIMNSSAVRSVLPVRLTNGWRLQGTTIKYVRRKPSMDDLDKDVALPLDRIQEHVIHLSVRPLLEKLLTLLGDGHEEKLGGLISRICSDEQYCGADAEVEQYLRHLLRLGFLIVQPLQVDIHHDQPLHKYYQGLSAIHAPEVEQVSRQLSIIGSLVEEYAAASLAERRLLLAEIKERLAQCSIELGFSPEALSLPKTILYEDTTLAPQTLALDRGSWSEIFSQLAEFQQLLPLVDIQLPLQLMTRGYFRARYGAGQRCDDFLGFADAFNVEFLRLFHEYGGDQQQYDDEGNLKRLENYFALPELEMLNDGRQAIDHYVRQSLQDCPGANQEIILGDDFFHSIAPFVPESVNRLQSLSFLSQYTRVGAEPLLVLNQIYSGLTLMFSRFTYCFAEDERTCILLTLRAALQRLQPSEAVFAELKGGYDATNLNLHPTLTSYELVCPGELSTRPAEEQILLEDLFIQDDRQTGSLRLYSKRLGKEVIPLYLGFLVPMLLPEIQQVLLSFSGLAICPLSLWRSPGVINANQTVIFYPRVRYKQILLQRAAWEIAPHFWPRRAPGQSDADFYLMITRWRRELDLPEQVFFSPVKNALAKAKLSTTNKPEEEVTLAPGASKPLYVDFENYFSVQLLDAAIRKNALPFRLTEMLPAQNHLWFKHNGQSYVSEFVFEMNSRGE